MIYFTEIFEQFDNNSVLFIRRTSFTLNTITSFCRHVNDDNLNDFDRKPITKPNKIGPKIQEFSTFIFTFYEIFVNELKTIDNFSPTHKHTIDSEFYSLGLFK